MSTAPHPVRSYSFDVACPSCGGVLHAIQELKIAVWETKAVVACAARGCRRTFVIRVTLHNAGRPDYLCGTAKGYAQHVKEDSDPCEACLEARDATSVQQRSKRHGLRELAGAPS